MIEIDPLLLESIGGSLTPAVTITAWRDGELTYPTATTMHDRIDVVSWSVTEDATLGARSADFTVAAQDEALLPRSLDGVLAPYGSEVHIQSGVDFGPELGTRLVSEGWFRIDSAKDREWREHFPETDEWALHGVVVDCRATDRQRVLLDARFETETTATSGSTVMQAIAALCRDLTPVATQHAVSDAPMGRIVFEDNDRVQAIDTLAARINARAVFNRDGQLRLVPRTAGTGHWRVPQWTLIDVQREMNADTFYNAVISTGRNPDTQEEYRARRVETSGPARYRTGHKVPYFHHSPLLTTQAATNAAAETTFQNVVRRRQSVATIETPVHHGLEVLDEVTFQHGPHELTGSVRRLTRRGGQGVGATMTLDVWLPLEDSRRLL